MIIDTPRQDPATITVTSPKPQSLIIKNTPRENNLETPKPTPGKSYERNSRNGYIVVQGKKSDTAYIIDNALVESEIHQGNN